MPAQLAGRIKEQDTRPNAQKHIQPGLYCTAKQAGGECFAAVLTHSQEMIYKLETCFFVRRASSVAGAATGAATGALHSFVSAWRMPLLYGECPPASVRRILQTSVRGITPFVRGITLSFCTENTSSFCAGITPSVCRIPLPLPQISLHVWVRLAIMPCEHFVKQI